MKISRSEDLVFAMIAGCAMLAVGSALVLLLYEAIRAVPPVIDSIFGGVALETRME